ncbi:MAG TPA: YwbE family protein [Nitrososphaeraceae archaeon]
MNSIKRKDIKLGSIVKIIEKENQKNGKLTDGIVKKILTSSATHPYGIKVILESGIVGRVKEVLN